MSPNRNGSQIKPGVSFRKGEKSVKKGAKKCAKGAKKCAKAIAKLFTSSPKKVTTAPGDCTTSGENVGKIISNIEKAMTKLVGNKFDPYSLDGIPIGESLKKLSLENGKVTGFKSLRLNDTCVTTKDINGLKEIRTTLWIEKLQLTYDVK